MMSRFLKIVIELCLLSDSCVREGTILLGTWKCGEAGFNSLDTNQLYMIMTCCSFSRCSHDTLFILIGTDFVTSHNNIERSCPYILGTNGYYHLIILGRKG